MLELVIDTTYGAQQKSKRTEPEKVLCGICHRCHSIYNLAKARLPYERDFAQTVHVYSVHSNLVNYVLDAA